jgi:hypothetical protein
MKQVIGLDFYLKLGGDLNKVDWNTSYCDYGGDNNRGAKVVSYEDKGDKNLYGEPLVYFTFDNGKTHRYAISWIKIEVDFTLDKKYFS